MLLSLTIASAAKRIRELLLDLIMVLLAMLAIAHPAFTQQATAQVAFYRPDSPERIVATLSDSVVSLAAQARSGAHSVSGNNTDFDAAVALRAIFTTYELARRENSPRAYGHTLQLLENWPAHVPLPDNARLIKASVLQHNHRFRNALLELAAIPEHSPVTTAVMQMHAQINLTIGDYAAARQSCTDLHAHGLTLPALNCQTQLQGLTGEAEPALASLQALLAQPNLDRVNRLEFLLTAADLARRLQQDEATHRYYQQALTLAPENHYALTLYCDWLLQRDQHSTVIELLAPRVAGQQDTELAILYTRALVKRGDSAEYLNFKARIDTRMLAMQQRGADRPHKLIAQYALYLDGDYALATQEALANFAVQKEPSDLLLLARAARASSDLSNQSNLSDLSDQATPSAQSAVRSWLELHGLQYPEVWEMVDGGNEVDLVVDSDGISEGGVRL